MVARIRLILGELNAATVVEDLDLHSFNLHPLTGDRKEKWSITVRANWRITFRFEQGLALDVNFEDYH
jgi:proteic killer suppression protein